MSINNSGDRIILSDNPGETIDINNDYVSSNIPSKIENLHHLRKSLDTPVADQAVEDKSIHLLKRELDDDLTLPVGYNGVCVDLDTNDHTLIVPDGGKLVCL